MIFYQFQKHRKLFFLASFFCLTVFAARLLYVSVPDEMYAVDGEIGEVRLSLPVTLERMEESIPVFSDKKAQSDSAKTGEYRLLCKFMNLIPVKEVTVHAVEKSYVMPSGIPIGIYTKTNGILIIGTGKVTADDGLNYEPADQIVRGGDYIKTVNGEKVSGKEDLVRLVNACGGDDVVLGILREGEEIEIRITPVRLADGTYRLGIWVRDDMAGVGTLTYIEQDLGYGALGHPVSDADTGSKILLETGNVYNTDIVGIVRGENGTPGELTGVIHYRQENCLGTIEENTQTGIYGTLYQVPQEMEEAFVEVGMKQEIRLGEAYILSSLDGALRQYRIEIDEIEFNSKEENKGILFHVTDEKLLAETGGIVQGMSGSPILQDGKIIGAVTHVFISDATKGYGVFIEKMMEH